MQWVDRLLRPVRKAMLRERAPSKKNVDAAEALPALSLPRFTGGDVVDPITGEARVLNIPHRFDPNCIDWNFLGHGKLWAYHLNYFGWLELLDDATAKTVMLDYSVRITASGIGAEPYPSSRRIQHWISVLLRWQNREPRILLTLYKDACRVAALPEFHLQANHLLQNALAVHAAAHFFADERLFKQSRELLLNEVTAQFLPDGSHVERSASYTADLCASFMRCIHLQQRSGRFNDELLTARLTSAVEGMLGWLDAYSFSDDSMAAIGDSSVDMMPPLDELRKAAKSLGINGKAIALRESGYRMVGGKNWEAVFNVGSPGPDYQPGHSHADSLTFCLHANGAPLVVDVGVSTYERNERRAWERRTSAHNTVVVAEESSSDVWASFRMGRRARVRILQEDASFIAACHDGYRRLGVRHVRNFDWNVPRVLKINDQLEGKRISEAISYLHFHPDVKLEQLTESSWEANGCRVSFSGMTNILAEPYSWAEGFNLLRPATRLRCAWGATSTGICFDI